MCTNPWHFIVHCAWTYWTSIVHRFSPFRKYSSWLPLFQCWNLCSLCSHLLNISIFLFNLLLLSAAKSSPVHSYSCKGWGEMSSMCLWECIDASHCWLWAIYLNTLYEYHQVIDNIVFLFPACFMFISSSLSNFFIFQNFCKLITDSKASPSFKMLLSLIGLHNYKRILWTACVLWKLNCVIKITFFDTGSIFVQQLFPLWGNIIYEYS